ncbi:MAG: hypothetical protein ACO1NN_01135 [Sphingopyxis sp.]
MPKAKNKITPKQQRERFEKAVREMIDAGELNPTDADTAFERLVGKVQTSKDDSKSA